jgi:hypothetical protein
MKNTTYHTVGIWQIWKPQHTTLSESVWYVVIFRQCGMLCFSYLSYSNSVVCCGFHICHIPTVWYVVFFRFVIFRQCGMLCYSDLSYSDSVVCCVWQSDLKTTTIWLSDKKMLIYLIDNSVTFRNWYNALK